VKITVCARLKRSNTQITWSAICLHAKKIGRVKDSLKEPKPQLHPNLSLTKKPREKPFSTDDAFHENNNNAK
jgi:hypothetical protein